MVERYNGPQIPWPLPEPQEESREAAVKADKQKGKTWSKEKEMISKKPGHRRTPGLLLGRALLSACPSGQNKPRHRSWAILENVVCEAEAPVT